MFSGGQFAPVFPIGFPCGLAYLCELAPAMCFQHDELEPRPIRHTRRRGASIDRTQLQAGKADGDIDGDRSLYGNGLQRK